MVPADDGWIHPLEDVKDNPPPPTPPKPSHRMRNLVVAVVVAAVVASAGVFIIPVPHSFSTRLGFAGGDLNLCCRADLNPPQGSYVSGSWSVPAGEFVHLGITDSSGQVVYDGFGTGGAFSFTASNPPYDLYAVLPANVSGTISYPVL
jgi:hypothetical protein